MKPIKNYFNKKNKRNQTATLTDYEQRVVKTLLEKGVSRQDITYLLNIGRDATLNLARTYDVKQGALSLTDEELNSFEHKQMSWDFKTGLNPYNSEVDCLVYKSKQAITQAVSIFNSPNNNFSLENYLLLINIAWLYLFQGICKRNKLSYTNKDGSTQALSYMIFHNTKFLQTTSLDSPLISNIDFVIKLRDFVAHDGIYQIPSEVITKLQANCINFNNALKKFFGEQNGLEYAFSAALQFASISLEQSKILAGNNSGKNILNFVTAYDKSLSSDILESEKYQFTITYIIINEKNKNKADAVRFITPEVENYADIKNILIKEISDDAKYPHMMKDVAKLTSKTTSFILDVIKNNDFRNIKTGVSNNKKMMKAYSFGKVVNWKYSDEFIDFVKKQPIKEKVTKVVSSNPVTIAI